MTATSVTTSRVLLWRTSRSASQIIEPNELRSSVEGTLRRQGASSAVVYLAHVENLRQPFRELSMNRTVSLPVFDHAELSMAHTPPIAERALEDRRQIKDRDKWRYLADQHPGPTRRRCESEHNHQREIGDAAQMPEPALHRNSKAASYYRVNRILGKGNRNQSRYIDGDRFRLRLACERR